MMNDRIKELMLEAGYAAPEIALRAQKLAELIVKEYVGILTKLGSSYSDSEYDADYMQGMLDSANIIKNHFGVNE